MKIVILADPLNNQGAGVHVYTKMLVKSLEKQKNQHETILICQKEIGFTDLPCILVPSIQMPIGYQSLRLFFIIPRIIKKLNPDVVIEPTHFGPFNLPGHIKRITIIHDLTPIMCPHWHRFHSQLLQRIFLKGILKRADLIVTNSQNTSKDLLSYAPYTKNKTQNVYLGKDPIFKPNSNSDLIKKYGVGFPFFLYVGTIEPRKNLSGLLHAYEKFRQGKRSKAQLVIIGGKGWKSKEFFKSLNNHPYKPDIVLPGYIPTEELPVFYTEALAFVYPSFYEGFGFPILEAMSCGTPCITSKVSSLPEVGGDAALYVDPYSASEIAEKMEMIASDKKLRESLSKKSLEQSSKFSWDKFGSEFLQLLDEKFNPPVGGQG